MFLVYILYSTTLNKHYIGYTTDLESRLAKHNAKGSKWTKNGIPWVVVFEKKFSNKTEAIKFERHLKKQKSRVVLETYIAGWRSSISPGP